MRVSSQCYGNTIIFSQALPLTKIAICQRGVQLIFTQVLLLVFTFHTNFYLISNFTVSHHCDKHESPETKDNFKSSKAVTWSHPHVGLSEEFWLHTYNNYTNILSWKWHTLISLHSLNTIHAWQYLPFSFVTSLYCSNYNII